MTVTKCALTAAVVLVLAVPAGAYTIPLPAGELQMKFTNLDTGTLYAVPPGPFGPVIGEAALNGLAQTPPPNRFGIEDSWGIARMTDIEDGLGHVVWDRATASQELVGVFWGERDTYLQQVVDPIFGATAQNIHGVGFKIAFFAVPGNQVINLPGTFTTASRTAEDVVTGLNTLPGTQLIWTLNSVPGKEDAFPTDEFFTTFFPGGNAFGGLNAFGGMYAQTGPITLFGGGTITGADNAQFCGFPSWDINFTGVQPNRTNTGFLVKSNDPILVNVCIPEPTTMAGLLLGLGTLAGYIRRRNLKRAA